MRKGNIRRRNIMIRRKRSRKKSTEVEKASG